MEPIQLSLKSSCGGGWHLDYSLNSGPYLRFSMRFDFLAEISDHSVCETRDLSLPIINNNFVLNWLLLVMVWFNLKRCCQALVRREGLIKCLTFFQYR